MRSGPPPLSFRLLFGIGHRLGLFHHILTFVMMDKRRLPVHGSMKLLCCASSFMNVMLEMERMGVESAEGDVDVAEL